MFEIVIAWTGLTVAVVLLALVVTLALFGAMGDDWRGEP